MSTMRVKSVSEYLSSVDSIFKALCNVNNVTNCELWYRGQAQQGFDLLPTITRKRENLQLNPLFETVFLSKFKSLATPYVGKMSALPFEDNPTSYWNWLFMLRHYGLPARILDWSRDALTGLFFATDPEDPSLTNGIDATVWILNPVKLNEEFSFHNFLKTGYIPSVEEQAFNLFFGAESNILTSSKPAAAIGPLNTARIVAQRGTFTVYPRIKNLVALDKFDDNSYYLSKINIAWECFAEIQIQLRHYGISKLSLYPDLETIAEEVFQEVIDEEIQTTQIQ